MKKSIFIIPVLGSLLFGCEKAPEFDKSELAKTWDCQTNDHVSSFNSTTSYNLDGSFTGGGDLRVDLPNNEEPALLKISVSGTWTMSGNEFTTNINKQDIESKNKSGASILEEAKKIASDLTVFKSTIISVEPSKVTYKEANSYFKKTCFLNG